MEITLEMIEAVKDRTGVSYKEAKEALEKAEGNVVNAIIAIEESIGEDAETGNQKETKAIIDKLKELIKKGNVSKIIVKRDDEIILNLPVNAGILGVVIAPWATVAGVIAAFGFKCEIEVIKDDGSIIDVSNMANETLGTAIEKGAVFTEEIRSKGSVVYEAVKEKSGEAYESVKEMAANRKEAFDFDDDDDFSVSPVDEVNYDDEDASGVEIDKE